MRYVIIGAGAIGSALAARLAQHSPAHPPVLVARGANADAIERHGLRVRSPEDDVTVRVDVVRTPAEAHLRADDVLVLATKVQQADAALREWVDAPVRAARAAGGGAADAPDADGRPDRADEADDAQDREHGDAVVGTAGDLLPVVVATNGVAAERIALRLFERVYAACVWLPAVHLEPGEVVIRVGPSSGTFFVGRYPDRRPDGHDARDRELLEQLASDWGAATFAVHVVEDVLRWKHGKLLNNLANGLDALVGPGAPVGALAQRLQDEARAVYRASGIGWTSDAEEKERRGTAFDRRPVPGVPAEQMGGSTWQSMARGTGSVETDYLNGEIVLLARLAGTSAPLNATLQRLVREAAAAGRSAGSTSVADLERALDDAAPPTV